MEYIIFMSFEWRIFELKLHYNYAYNWKYVNKNYTFFHNRTMFELNKFCNVIANVWVFFFGLFAGGYHQHFSLLPSLNAAS